MLGVKKTYWINVRKVCRTSTTAVILLSDLRCAGRMAKEM
jgi:hypothetical protein